MLSISGSAWGESAMSPPSPARDTLPVEHHIFRHIQMTMVNMNKRCFKGLALSLSAKEGCQRDAHHVYSLLKTYNEVNFSHQNALPGLIKNWNGVMGRKLVSAGLIDDATI